LTGVALSLLVTVACGSSDNKKHLDASDGGVGGEAGAAGEPATSGGSMANPQAGNGGKANQGGTGVVPQAGQGGEPEVPQGGMGGEPNPPQGGQGGDLSPPIGGQGGEGGAPLEPLPELLFSVRPAALGLEGTGVASVDHPNNVIFTSGTGAPTSADGQNAVKIVGTELGLDASDTIASFTLLQPEPRDPMYFFSITDGAEGATSTRVYQEYWEGQPSYGDVYFSDAVESYRWLGEGGDEMGYNGLLASESSLGLAVQIDGPPDDLTGLFMHDANLPITELYFTVSADAVGAPGSAVANTPVAERGCTVFKSTRDGNNSLVASCASLGLIADDQIDGLLVYGTDTPSKVVFSVTNYSQGATGTAVALAVQNYERPGATLFSSPGDESNAVFVGYEQLGLGNTYDDELDAIAVLDAPQQTARPNGTCNLTPDPFDTQNGGLTYLNGTSRVGSNVLVLFGGNASTPRLLAYDASTCQRLQAKDMETELHPPAQTAIVPLAGWSAAAPLDKVEYYRPSAGPPQFNVHDASGELIRSISLNNFDYYDIPDALLYEPSSDSLYVVAGQYSNGYRLGIALVPRPDDQATSVDLTFEQSSLPCTISPDITGTDPTGNLIVAQEQTPVDDDAPRFRVCAFRPDGELLYAPYWWTPNLYSEQKGFIGGGAHYLVDTNASAGPVVVERSVLQGPLIPTEARRRF
jgi:hypothetical protein